MKSGSPLPKVVSKAEWQAAHEQLIAREKAATRARYARGGATTSTDVSD